MDYPEFVLNLLLSHKDFVTENKWQNWKRGEIYFQIPQTVFKSMDDFLMKETENKLQKIKFIFIYIFFSQEIKG